MLIYCLTLLHSVHASLTSKYISIDLFEQQNHRLTGEFSLER